MPWTIQGYRWPVAGLVRFSVRKTRVFSWGLADEHHPFAGGEPGQVHRHHVVLPLFGREGDEGDLFLDGEGFDRPDEGLADRVHQRRGGKRVPAVVPEERRHAPLVLELRDVDVEVHAIHALDFQRDVLP